MTKAPIAVALDAPDLVTAREWATAVAPHVQVVKVGLEVFLIKINRLSSINLAEVTTPGALVTTN